MTSKDDWMTVAKEIMEKQVKDPQPFPSEGNPEERAEWWAKLARVLIEGTGCYLCGRPGYHRWDCPNR